MKIIIFQIIESNCNINQIRYCVLFFSVQVVLSLWYSFFSSFWLMKKKKELIDILIEIYDFCFPVVSFVASITELGLGFFFLTEAESDNHHLL